MTRIAVHRFENGNQGKHSVVAYVERHIYTTTEKQLVAGGLCCPELSDQRKIQYIKLQHRYPVVLRDTKDNQPYVMLPSDFPKFFEESNQYLVKRYSMQLQVVAPNGKPVVTIHGVEDEHQEMADAIADTLNDKHND